MDVEFWGKILIHTTLVGSNRLGPLHRTRVIARLRADTWETLHVVGE